MVRVSGREYNGLIDSPCFVNATDAKSTLTCFSCHTMHKTPDDPRSIAEWADTHQVAAGMEGNGACLQCHAVHRDERARAHEAPAGIDRQLVLQLPHAVHDVRPAESAAEPSDQQSHASPRVSRPAVRMPATPAISTRRWPGRRSISRSGTEHRRSRLSEDEQTVAASLLWLLRGDAGQRALAAWSMGWAPARQASGTGWMAVPLAMLLNDPYDAVRFIAQRSLALAARFRGLPVRFSRAARRSDRRDPEGPGALAAHAPTRRPEDGRRASARRCRRPQNGCDRQAWPGARRSPRRPQERE